MTLALFSISFGAAQTTETTSGEIPANIRIFRASSGIENPAGAATVPANLTVTGRILARTTLSSVNEGEINASTCGLRSAPAWCSGSDVGAWINAAVALWKKNVSSTPCRIAVTAPGTISTAPNIALGCQLDFYASMTLSVSWPIYHHGVIIDFHGNKLVANTTVSPAIDIGKASAFVSTPGTVNTNGVTVTWVSGPDFSDLDLGDQIAIGSRGYNIARINSSKSLTLVASAGSQTGATYIAVMDPENAISNNPTILPVVLKNLVIIDGTTTYDAIRVTATSNLELDHPHFYGPFGCSLRMRGAITANVLGLISSGQQNGVFLDSFSSGGFFSGSNSNRFTGIDIANSASAGTNAIATWKASSGNSFTGLRLEGNANNVVVSERGGGELYQFSDYERNGTGKNYEISVFSNNNTFIGPSQVQSSAGNVMAIDAGTSGNVVENLQFNAQAACSPTCPIALMFSSGATGRVINITKGSGQYILPAAGIQDTSGDYNAQNLNVAGVIATNGAYSSGASNGDIVLRQGNCLSSATAANNEVVCALTMNSSKQVKLDPNGQGTSIGGGAFITSSNKLPQVGTPAVGHVACVKSAGPPVVFGYCSTQPTTSGTCTCN